MTQTVLLGNLVDISSSKRIFYKEYVNSGVPFYRSKEIIERAAGKKNISTELFISEERFNEIEGKFGAPKGGDLLLTSVGTLGIPYLVQQGEKFYFKDGNLTWFRNFKPELNRNYFLYWLTSQDGKNELLNHTIGSTQKALTIQGLKRVKVPLPDIETQKKIADILGAIDEKIELNRRMNETLEQMGQALFRHYFIDNPEVKNWEEVALSNLIEFIGGSQPPKSEHIYEEKGGYVRFVQNRDYSSDGHKTYIPIAKRNKLCNETDIMMDKYGEAGRVRYGIAGAYNVALAKIVPQKENMQEFLRAYFSMPQIQRSLESAAAASTRSSLNATTFAGFKVKLPADELLIDFENSHRDILHTIMANSEQIQTLTALRDTLLPRLINGRVKI